MAKNEEMEMQSDEMLDQGSGPRVYELGFHLDPELPTEEVKSAYKAIRTVIESVGTVIAEGEAEKIPLAYTISRQDTAGRRDFDSAYFCWIAYETDSTKHAEVAAAAKADSRIVRFLDILTTKDEARHSAELREMREKMPEPAPEAVSDTQLDAALEEVSA